MSLTATAKRTEINNISKTYFRNHDDDDEGAHFRLDSSFLDLYKDKKPNFGFNGLGEFVFYRTYSRLQEDGTKETFLDSLKRVIEGCFEIQRRHQRSLHLPWDYDRAQPTAQEMFRRMWEFKFLPPGRGLWMMGTPFMWERGSAALNNCFEFETEIITRDGIKDIGVVAGTTQRLLTKGGKWVDAKIKSFGEQELYKLTIHRGRHRKTIFTTRDHRWFVKSKSKALAIAWGSPDESKSRYKTRSCNTDDLNEGMRLCINYGSGINNANLRPSVIGIMHGICCGDGTTGSSNPSHGTYLYLCGNKDAELLHYFGDAFHITDAPERGAEGAKRIADLPRYFRKMPSLSEASTYLYGWLAGYFAADGKISNVGTPQICSAERTNLEYVRSICAILGIGCHDITHSLQTVTYPDGSKKKFLGYAITLFNNHLNEDFFLLSHHKDKYKQHKATRCKSTPAYEYWYVDHVEATGDFKEVYCAQVPEYHCFTLAGNILTGNCGFVSTYDKIETDPAEPFCFMMDMSMLGVGVGFDTRGAGRIGIRKPKKEMNTYQIPDSREGWAESVRQLIYSYTIAADEGHVDFDYGSIRPAGTEINGFGGKASGPDILIELHDLIRAHLERRINQTLSSVDIVDLMNYIGRCVVAGNVRRTAEIAFGDPDDFDYCSMKNPTASLNEEDKAKFFDVANKLYAQNRHKGEVADFKDSGIPLNRLCPALETWNALNHHRWASNNSIFARVGQDYKMVGEQIAANGEPGLMWLNNMRDFGRMADGRQPGIDGRVMGGNPCLEQSLESYELCNLVETFPANHDDADDYMRTLKFAYLYAKTVTLLPTHNRRTNQVTLRNRRIGLSQSGIVQAFAKFGRRNVLHDFCDSGYTEIRRWDDVYSEWLCVNRSIKVTSVKPSGTVSLVADATPGIHHPVASTYWRRVRISADSVLVNILKDAGFEVEPAISDKDRTVVAKFAVTDERVRPVGEVSIWEQMQNVADYQSLWADNQVSCTVTFNKDEAGDISRVLESFEDKIKGISFMPAQDHGFAQAPYEACTPEEVAEYNQELKDTNYSSYVMEAVGSKFCDGDTCTINS